MSLHDDLVAAKALIADPAKWHKGTYHNGAGDCHCAIGAVLVVTGEAPMSRRVCACRDALQLQLPGFKIKPVGLYNDQPSTTHDDIMALFDRAIAAASVSS